MKRFALIACAFIAGCQNFGVTVQSALQPGSSAVASGVGVQANLPGNPLAGAMLIGILFAEEARYFLRNPDDARTPYYGAPPPDPARRVNQQDCTRPIDLDAGNLMCR